MKTPSLIAGLSFIIFSFAPAIADERWQPPQKVQCSVAPNQDCGMDVQCPAKTPYVLSGGGGLPKVSDAAHNLAMTMNVAISPNTWRVRWRNLGDKKLDVTAMIRVLCTKDGDAWGK